ncbi:hypothetical protein K438DRAFT_1953167 [Mycena galopus ATCC 62051]|nr:hypothetical protein K438DRAFT_1953167 [Mycena galopus ATCC 62051]
MVTHHVSDTSNNSNEEANNNSDDNPVDDHKGASSFTAVHSSLSPPCGRQAPPIIVTACEQWESCPDAPSAGALAVTPTPKPTCKQRKKEKHCESRRVKREAMRKVPGHPKAIALCHACQSSPIRLDFNLSAHHGAASTGWMGLCELEAVFVPESCNYSLEEAQEIPGMKEVNWDRIPAPLIDADCHVIGVLGGLPCTSDLMEEAAANIHEHQFSGVYCGTCREEKLNMGYAQACVPWAALSEIIW